MRKVNKVNKVYRILAYIILIPVLGFIVWFALVNYNIIESPYEDKVELITLSQSEVRLKKKNTYQLSVTTVPTKARNSIVLYSSSNPKVATVNELSGFITALDNGTTTITATLKTDKRIKAECDVIVSENDVMITRIDLNTKSINLQVGNTYPITYKLVPKEATLHSIAYYSSDTSVATVNNAGVVEGVSEGRAIISITDKVTGIKTSLNVTVYEEGTTKTDNNEKENVNDPKSISISPKVISLNVGASRKLEVTILPDKTNKNVTWRSLDTDVATVDSTGKVVGKKSGSTKIIATTVNGLDAYTEVTVNDDVINVNKITVEPTNMTLSVGDKRAFSYKITPDNATNQGVMISSSDDEIISIKDNNIIGLKPGTATVTITTVDGDYNATIKVTVTAAKNIVRETDVTLSTTRVNLTVGGTHEVVATIKPSNATYKDLTWKSSNTNVATVDNGLIVGTGSGKAEITVSTHNKITKKIVVNVSKTEITSITLDKSDERIKLNETLSLVKTIIPDSASSQTVSWDSSNTSVATVDSNGLVKGVGIGKAIITVRTNNGKTASCMVEVTK